MQTFLSFDTNRVNVANYTKNNTIQNNILVK